MTVAGLVGLGVAAIVTQLVGTWILWRLLRAFGAFQDEERLDRRQRAVQHEQQQFLYREFVRLHGEQMQMTRDLQRLKESA